MTPVASLSAESSILGFQVVEVLSKQETEYGTREDIRANLNGVIVRVCYVSAVVLRNQNVSYDALRTFEKEHYARFNGLDLRSLEECTLFINKPSFQKRSPRFPDIDLLLDEQQRCYELVRSLLKDWLQYQGSLYPSVCCIGPVAIKTLVRFYALRGQCLFSPADGDDLPCQVADCSLGSLEVGKDAFVLSNKHNVSYLRIGLSEDRQSLCISHPFYRALTEKQRAIFQKVVTDDQWILGDRTYACFSKSEKFTEVVSFNGSSVYITGMDENALGAGASTYYYPSTRITVQPDGSVHTTKVAHGLNRSFVMTSSGSSEKEIVSHIAGAEALYRKLEKLTQANGRGLCVVLGVSRHAGFSKDRYRLCLSIYKELLWRRLDRCFNLKAAEFCTEPKILENKRRCAFDLLEALKRLHDEGLMHRDIKFQNIMLTMHGGFKLIDYGDMLRSTEVQGTKLYLPASFFKVEEGRFIIQEKVFPDDDYKNADLFAMGLVLLFLEDPNIYKEFLQRQKCARRDQIPAAFMCENWLTRKKIWTSPIFPVIRGLLVEKWSTDKALVVMRKTFPKLAKEERISQFEKTTGLDEKKEE